MVTDYIVPQDVDGLVFNDIIHLLNIFLIKRIIYLFQLNSIPLAVAIIYRGICTSLGRPHTDIGSYPLFACPLENII